jgi:hypothetical protein
MALIKLNDNPSTRELRQFAAIWFPAFWLVVGAITYNAGGSTLVWSACVGVALVGALIGFRQPGFIRPVYIIWMYLAYPIGWVVSHLVMGIVFYLVVTPIGLVMRLCGYDPLRMRRRRAEASHWVACEPVGSTRNYFRQY